MHFAAPVDLSKGSARGRGVCRPRAGCRCQAHTRTTGGIPDERSLCRPERSGRPSASGYQLLADSDPWQFPLQVQVLPDLVMVIPLAGRAWTSRVPFTWSDLLVMAVLVDVFITE
jgi:hypothetical protein